MIRTATLDDLESVLKLEQTFGAEAFSRRSLRHHIKKGMTLVIDETDIRGYSIVMVRRGSTLARLYSITVSEQYRGNGYGQALLAASESLAIKLGSDRIRLEVAEGNAIAQKLYLSNGYGRPIRLNGYYGDGEAAIRLVKTLGRSGATF
jgi:ribosomal protein S18 acetylase RimI-like enzyme